MAITPAPGYITDPNNPNAVMRDPNSMAGAGFQMTQATGGTSLGTTNTNPTLSAPQTAPAPAPAPVNAPAPATTAPATTTTAPTTAPQTAGTAPQATQTAPTGTMTMPANGSVVDLLNTAGADSSYAARATLAQQYGIQGYSGTAAQNTQLAQKYIDAHNALKGTATPQSGAAASSAMDQHFTDANKQTPQDATKSSFDNYLALNPIMKQMYDTVQQALSSQGTQQTFSQEYQQLMASTGLQALQTDRMNIQNVMNGTDDDVRTEITKAGGFATESQVAGMVAARNKTLMKQASAIDSQIQQKEDYINHIMQFSQLDRAEATRQVDQKLNLLGTLQTMQTKMETASRENYQKVVDTVGYAGLIQTFKGNTDLQGQAEKSLGLAPGSLAVGSPLAVDLGKQATQNKAQVIGGESTGYFSYDPATQKTTPILAGTGNTSKTEGTDLADAKAFLTAHPNISPEQARQLFLSKHPSSATAWDAYFADPTTSKNVYPTAPPPAKTGLFGFGFLGL